MEPGEAANRLTRAEFETRVLAFIGLGIVALGFVFCLPPIPQDQSYHAFADDRTMVGIPNFLNVISNLPFLVVGYNAGHGVSRHTLKHLAAALGTYWLYRVVKSRRPVAAAAHPCPGSYA